jgi:hypothetical protein
MIVFAPCSNLAASHYGRLGNVVLGGHVMPLAGESITATDEGRNLVAKDTGLTLVVPRRLPGSGQRVTEDE